MYIEAVLPSAHERPYDYRLSDDHVIDPFTDSEYDDKFSRTDTEEAAGGGGGDRSPSLGEDAGLGTRKGRVPLRASTEHAPSWRYQVWLVNWSVFCNLVDYFCCFIEFLFSLLLPVL